MQLDATTPTLTLRRSLLLMLAGGTLGALCDHCHVWGGVLAYPGGRIDGQAWWVIPLFAGAALAVAQAPLIVARLLKRELQPLTSSRALIYGFLFFAAYASTAIFSAWPTTLLVVLGLLYVPVLVVERSRVLIVATALTAIVGSLFEAALSATGAFYYTQPDFLGIPRWLPALYLWAALAGRVMLMWGQAHEADVRLEAQR